MTSEVWQGDCLEVLKRLPDASVHACVTDPPYGLSSTPDIAEVVGHWLRGEHYEHKDRGGFMGKHWDSFVPGPDYWREVFRVLKPGAHALVFAGTRTVDLMSLSLRFAGFEIRDGIDWMYGCLDEQSEILTVQGWKRGTEVTKGERVATWDPETGEIRMSPVLGTTRAPFSGKMVRFKNDNTDQRLTPNHRVYKQHALRKQQNGARRRFFEDNWSVAEAAEINRHQAIRLPLAGFHDGPGIGSRDYAALLGWIFTEGGFDASGTGVRITQSSVNPDHVLEIDRLVRLFAPGFKKYERARTYEPANGSSPRDYVEHTWFFSGDPAIAIRQAIPGKHPTFDLLWQMSLDEKRAFLNAAMNGDGSIEGMAFYQKDDADRDWFATLAHVVGWQARDNPQKQCVSLHANPTTELQSRHLHANHLEQYDGEVWCVRVETGAFLARRNGRIFITGNSGFPKSLDASKAIDRTLGARREAAAATVTAAGSPEAAEWVGWGTALKPAREPVIVARKPLDGTLAQNLLKWGCGAINVDGCRIGTSGGTAARSDSEPNYKNEVYGAGMGGNAYEKLNAGRWPANVILDEEAGAMLDEQAGGSGASRFFYCAKTSRKERDVGCESLPPRSGGEATDRDDGADGLNSPRAGAGRSGGVRNHHPTVKPVAVMRWLTRLVSRPGQIVIDPFCGSGSSGIAASLEGVHWLGIEREPEYAEIARLRVAAAETLREDTEP